MGIGFGVGIVLARAFGPEDFGRLSYVIAVASLLGSFASLGFDDLLPRDLASGDREVSRSDAVKTAMLLRILAESLAYGGFILYFWMREGAADAFWFAIIYGMYFLLQATDVIEYGRRVDGDFQGIAQLRLGASLASALLKLLIAALGLPFLLIAGAMVFEFLIATLYYLWQSLKKIDLKRGLWNSGYAFSLLQRAAPLIISGLLGTLQARIDSLLIEDFLGAGQLGLYAAAQRVVELLDAFGIVLSILLIPEFGRRQGPALDRWAQAAYLAGAFLYLLAIPILLLLWQLFPWIYGRAFLEGQAAMLWLLPRPFFYLLGMIRMGLLLSEEHYRRIPLYSALSFSLTFLFFKPLVTQYGLEGAAMAGTLAMALSGFGLDLLIYPVNIRRMINCTRALPDLTRALSRFVKKSSIRSEQ